MYPRLRTKHSSRLKYLLTESDVYVRVTLLRLNAGHSLGLQYGLCVRPHATIVQPEGAIFNSILRRLVGPLRGFRAPWWVCVRAVPPHEPQGSLGKCESLRKVSRAFSRCEQRGGVARCLSSHGTRGRSYGICPRNCAHQHSKRQDHPRHGRIQYEQDRQVAARSDENR